MPILIFKIRLSNIKNLSEVETELENNEKAQKKYQEISEKFGTTIKALGESLSNLGEDLKIEKI